VCRWKGLAGRQVFGVATALLAAGFALTLLVAPWRRDITGGDLEFYQLWAKDFLAGHLPYREVAFEYPPLAAVLLALAGLPGTDLGVYRISFAAAMFVAALGLIWCTGRVAKLTGGDRGVAMLIVAAVPLILGTIVRGFFDLVPVALTVIALALVLMRRPAAGGVTLGVGALVKGFPLFALPPIVAWLMTQRGSGEAGRAALACGATVAALGGAWLAFAPGGARATLERQFDRPVQVESSPAAVLEVTGAVRHLRWEYGSNNVVAGAEPAARRVSGLLVLVAVAACTLLAARTDLGGRGLVLAALTAVCAFAALGKVLSPQFVLWVVPLAALAAAWRNWLLASTLATAIVLTRLEFPGAYDDLLALQPEAIALVALRDAALILSVLIGMALLSGRARSRPLVQCSPEVLAHGERTTAPKRSAT
jgi:hypothetical protein